MSYLQTLFIATVTLPTVLLAQLNSWPLLMTSSIVANNKTAPNLTIHAFVNYGGFIYPLGALCTEATQIALDAASKRLDVMKRYKIELEMHDEKCDMATAVALAVDVLESSKSKMANTVPLLIAPMCGGSAFTGMIVKQYNFTEVSSASTILPMYVARQAYSAHFSVLPSMEMFYEAVPAFLQSSGWKRVFLLGEGYSFWAPLEEILMANLQMRNISLAGVAKVIVPPSQMPEPEHFQMAAQEVASMPDPRIIVVLTSYGAMVACYLHRNGIYGPKFVFLYPLFSSFSPKSYFRPKWCSEEMLLEALGSVTYFSFASPIDVFAEEADELGTTKEFFESELKRRILDHPEFQDNWINWRGQCYNQAMVTLITLDKVDSQLRQTNDSLGNWVAESANFRQNGSYISSLIQGTIEHLKFKGIISNEDEPPNSRKGRTGFFQVQLSVPERELDKNADLLPVIKLVPVAIYNSAKQRAVIEPGPGKLVWRGRNAPPDSLLVIEKKDPILGLAATVVLSLFAALFLLANIAFLVANIYRRQSPNIVNSCPLLNSVILTGNVFMTSFVFVLPFKGSLTSHVNCMAASFLIVLGFHLVLGSLLAKLEVAFLVATRVRVGTPGNGNMFQLGPISIPSTTMPSVESSLSRSVANKLKRAIRDKIQNLSFGFIGIWVFLQILLLAFWFGFEPIQAFRFERGDEMVQNDENAVYHHYTLSCNMSSSTAISRGFCAILICCYAGVTLRTLYLTVALRRVRLSEINDLLLVKTTSQFLAILILAAGCVLAAFFNDADPAALETAIGSVVLTAVFLIDTLLFVPKLKNGFYVNRRRAVK